MDSKTIPCPRMGFFHFYQPRLGGLARNGEYSPAIKKGYPAFNLFERGNISCSGMPLATLRSILNSTDHYLISLLPYAWYALASAKKNFDLYLLMFMIFNAYNTPENFLGRFHLKYKLRSWH